MAKEQLQEGKMERGARFMRNASLVAALALEGSAVVFAPIANVASTLAGLNIFQAGGFELFRDSAKRRRAKNARLKA
jgi:hypothetical protein